MGDEGYLLSEVSLIDNLLEHVNEIVVLSVDIADDDDGFSKSNDIWLLSYIKIKHNINFLVLVNLLKILVASPMSSVNSSFSR